MLRVTGLCAGNSPGTGEFPEQMASNAENVSIWWRHPFVTLYCWIINGLLIIMHPEQPFEYLNNIYSSRDNT